jgi:hypothetical protein
MSRASTRIGQISSISARFKDSRDDDIAETAGRPQAIDRNSRELPFRLYLR